MPFVKRQRTYYKDGVEVLADTITDFGRTAYYKNVVTTKYWKEITTGSKELEYACYKGTWSPVTYYYAKVPLGSDYTLYLDKDSAGNLASLSTINPLTGWKFSSITEQSAKFDGGSLNRYTAGDLYKDTTVTETVEGTLDDYTYTTEEIAPVEVTADDEYDYSEFIPSTQFDNYEDSNKLYQLAANKRTYYKYGTEPNATVTGSFARIDNGVASGFSASNYLELPESFLPNGQSWEAVTKVNATSFLEWSCIFSLGYNNSSSSDKKGISVNALNGELYISFANGGSNFTHTASNIATLSTNTDYWVKVEFTGNEYNLYLSTSGEFEEPIYTYTSSVNFLTENVKSTIGTYIYGGAATTQGYWVGSIDFSQSYININGERWWSGDSYTKVGSWIEDGIVSGFSSANYLSLPSLFDISKGQSWEVVFKFNTNSPSAQQTFLGSAGSRGYNPRIRLREGVVNIMLTNSTSSADVVSISGVTSVLANVDYWIKAEFTGSAYNLYLSTDGVIYNLEATKETTAVFTASYQLSQIGYLYDSGSSAGYPFDGSIDFTQSYININGERWWNGIKAYESNSTDYDHYTEQFMMYSPITRDARIYFKQDLQQRDTGTYTFTLDKDSTAKLLFVGNGGPGCSSAKDSQWHYSTGGSGACFEGVVRLPADTYTLTIGTLGYAGFATNNHYNSGGVASTASYLTNSAGVELIRVGAGGKGYTSVGGYSGDGGTLTLGALDVVKTIKAINGIKGGNTSSTNYAVSVYDWTQTGYGAGTGSTQSKGTTYGVKGVFDLDIEADKNEAEYYEDTGIKIY